MFFIALAQRLCFDISFDIFFTSFDSSQVSLRDPLRCGAGDEELREIIGAAVCFLLNNKLFLLICYLMKLWSFSFKNRYHAMQNIDKCALHTDYAFFSCICVFPGLLNQGPITLTIMLSVSLSLGGGFKRRGH